MFPDAGLDELRHCSLDENIEIRGTVGEVCSCGAAALAVADRALHPAYITFSACNTSNKKECKHTKAEGVSRVHVDIVWESTKIG